MKAKYLQIKFGGAKPDDLNDKMQRKSSKSGKASVENFSLSATSTAYN